MEIQWDKVRSRFKKLRTQQKYQKYIGDKNAELWNPSTIPIEEVAYSFIMSDRARGKTNQLLLLLMIAGFDYNKRIEYVRTTEEEAAPKNILSLLDVILSYDYIEHITKGKYNSAFYKGRYWYYCKVQDGKVTEQADTPFMHISYVRQYMELKSGYNCPDSDIILYDEFIGKETEGDFLAYAQLQSTYYRLRKGCKAFFLANTINKDALFFYEFCIAKPLEKMQQGDNKIISNPLGTNFYVELLTSDRSQTKQRVNTEYYGFENPKLASITGAETWSFKEYQHIDSNIEFEYLDRSIYIYYHGKYYRCDIVYSELGMCVYCHRATRTYDDSKIFTMEQITDKRYIYKLGENERHKRFWLLYTRGHFYYDTNETGDTIERYFNTARRKTG